MTYEEAARRLGALALEAGGTEKRQALLLARRILLRVARGELVSAAKPEEADDGKK